MYSNKACSDWLRYIVAAIVIAAAINPASADSHNKAQPPLTQLQIMVGDTPLTVEVANSSQQRYMGLSFRQELATDFGMLFVYPGERPLTFTMRNTLLPLSIAFISADWIIRDIHRMNVGPNQLFESALPAQYALEVNQGWFAQHGIEVGTRIRMR